MIANYIQRKLEKTQISSLFKSPINDCISQLIQKYPQRCNQKTFTVKKVSQKILKICRQIMNKNNLQDCLRVFEFVKNLMMELYQGLSYEVYLIKTQLHLLIMRWFQIAVKHQKTKLKMLKTKQQLFIQRNKLYIDQIERSSLSSLFFKDFYSNIELILFQLIKLDIEKKQYQSANLIIKKTFQTLRLQVLELNQLLFYLEKKVYDIMNVKTNLMMDLFIMETITHFLNMFAQNKQQFQSTMQNSNWKLLKMNNIWAKYARIFEKLPNNIEKQQCFQKVQQILSSNQIINSSNQLDMQRIQQEKNQSQSSSQSDSDSNSQLEDQKQNLSKISIVRDSQLIKTKNRQKRRSSFKNMKEDQYEDFINFLIQDKHICVDKLQPNNLNKKQGINSEDKQEQLAFFKQIFAKAYLKKQQKPQPPQIQLEEDQKQSYSNSAKLNNLKNQKQYNLIRLKRIKSNSLTLLQKLKTQQTQKLRHDNPLQKQDLNVKKRSCSAEIDKKSKKQIISKNKFSSNIDKKDKTSSLFSKNSHQKSHKNLFFQKNIVFTTLKSVKLPILLIK